MAGVKLTCMALRDQPYIPLYVQDFETDEKLIYCSALSTGVYIRIMCHMHKSEEYGTILLKQNFKQTVKPVENFAMQLAKILPYDVDVIKQGLSELIAEKVLHIEGDYLIQKRMVRDNEISMLRSKYGKKGGIKTQKKFASSFAKAKVQANNEYENEYENEYKDDNELIEKGGMGENVDPDVITPEVDEDVYLFDNFWDDYDKKVGSKEKLRKKWKSISDANKLKIKDHIRLYKISQPDKKYRKNPETYINNKSWNDEIITSNGNRYTTNKRAGITEDYKNSILARLQGASDTEDVPEHNHTLRGF